MARKKTEIDQPPLVPLTDEELQAAGPKLAGLVKDLEDLDAAHKVVRTAQAKARKKLRGQMAALAGQIRSQGR